MASIFYNTRIAVSRSMHAVERIRQLFAKALGYEVPCGGLDYGLRSAVLQNAAGQRDSTDDVTDASQRLLFLHGSSWPSKEWPLTHWQSLAELATSAGFKVQVPSGSEDERIRAQTIAGENENIEVLPAMGLAEVMRVFSQASGAVSLDSGLGHIAAALHIPTVALYGATNPDLTANYGENQLQMRGEHLPCIPCLNRICKFKVDQISTRIHPPCFSEITPEQVWSRISESMAAASKIGSDR